MSPTYGQRLLDLCSNIDCISPIRYVYDPVPKIPSYLAIHPLSFPAASQNRHTSRREHAFRLDPRAAHLPYRCGFDEVYETRYWKESQNAARRLLELLAEDKQAGDIALDHGMTLAQIAREELRPGFEFRFTKAFPYTYCFADRRRSEILGAASVMLCIFDEKFELTSESTERDFLDDFVGRLAAKNGEPASLSDGGLQDFINEVIEGFRDCDRDAGNGGEDMIKAMMNIFRRDRAVKKCQSVGEYLAFRRHDIGGLPVIASVKFSIASSVNLDDLRFASYLMHFQNHLAFVNDIASFEKELLAYTSGESKEMINIVDVVRSVMSLSTADHAKAVSLALQLETESCMYQEIERLRALDGTENELSDDEWWFLEPIWAFAAGNAFYSMVTVRYGGEKARV